MVKKLEKLKTLSNPKKELKLPKKELKNVSTNDFKKEEQADVDVYFIN